MAQDEADGSRATLLPTASDENAKDAEEAEKAKRRKQNERDIRDARFRCCADVFINFVYPTFLFMVFPVFVARSSSYMDAISIATGVFFAIQWDGESADIELKPAD